jgi:hypothetical protein
MICKKASQDTAFDNTEIVLQVLISPTFFEQLFCAKVKQVTFLYLQFRFISFVRKEISAKAADMLLVN